jgi:hypothetical protein
MSTDIDGVVKAHKASPTGGNPCPSPRMRGSTVGPGPRGRPFGPKRAAAIEEVVSKVGYDGGCGIFGNLDFR